ncbi:hypothetical protein HK104_003765 [Borealophlyctis nickersoniae]|nr:hypothetical protein HK104_003765 [Borealophlyctis nickersoniae]
MALLGKLPLANSSGVNLSVARLGSVFNDFLSPHLALAFSVPVAMWFGLLMCIASLIAGLFLMKLDARNEGREAYAFPMELASTSDLETDADDADSDRRHPVRAVHGHALVRESLRGIFDFSAFPLPFWLLCLIMCLMYATVIPFNTIHAAFLQTKWFKDDPKTAAQVMAVPDTISAILVPLSGLFVDKYGHHTHVLITCGGLMTLVHLYLGTVSPESAAAHGSPIPALAVLGIAYSMLLTIWPCIPAVVDESKLAMAYGLATAVLNLSLTVFPIVVASLVNADPTYFTAEMFFVLCSGAGAATAAYLAWTDRREYGGALNTISKKGPSYTTLSPRSADID